MPSLGVYLWSAPFTECLSIYFLLLQTQLGQLYPLIYYELWGRGGQASRCHPKLDIGDLTVEIQTKPCSVPQPNKITK